MKPSSLRGRSHWPRRLYPKAVAQPSLRRSSVWHQPAETWVYDSPWSIDGISQLPMVIIPASHGTAITSEENCMKTPSWNLGVWHSLIQRWNLALPIDSTSAVSNMAITAKKHCMIRAGRNLSVYHCLRQGRNIALKILIPSTSHSNTITTK